MAEQLDFGDLLRIAPPIEERLDLWTPDDIFAALDQGLIGQFGEDYRLDRKSARKEPRDFGADISAFANTPPYGGVILIGVEDDGRLAGFFGVGQRRLNDLHQIGDTCPDARVDFRHIPIINDKGLPDTILAVRVPFSVCPQTC